MHARDGAQHGRGLSAAGAQFWHGGGVLMLFNFLRNRANKRRSFNESPWERREKKTNWRNISDAVLRVGMIVFITGIVAITSIRWIDPLTSSVILQANLFEQQPSNESSEWISFDWQPWENISKQMAVAVLAAEDQRFPEHHGLDFVELSNSLSDAWHGREDRLRGASTITQQVAKNLFLSSERSYMRKILEAVLAIYIDLAWGKQRVLEIYMNVVQFGPTIYGVENASQHFFGKSASKINRHEASRLAAVLPNPNNRSATRASTHVLERQRWILKQMRALGGVGILDQL